MKSVLPKCKGLTDKQLQWLNKNGELRQPPDVGEIHGKANDGEEEVQVAAPGLTLSVLCKFNRDMWDRGQDPI